MLPLCKALGITANELLSGKLLTTENEYREIAEQNLLTLKSQQEKSTKHLLTLEYAVGYMSSISLFVLVFIASFCELWTGLRIGLIVLESVNFEIGVHFCLKIEKKQDSMNADIVTTNTFQHTNLFFGLCTMAEQDIQSAPNVIKEVGIKKTIIDD